MIKRLVWFATGLATGVGAVVVLGRRLRRRVAALAPVRVAERGAQRLRAVATNARDAVREGVDTMREREQELRARLDDRVSGNSKIPKDAPRANDSKVIVLRDAARSTRGR